MEFQTITEALAFAAKNLTPQRIKRLQSVALNRQTGIMVVMEDVHNAHNLMAIARSCDAFGVQHLGFTLNNQTEEDIELAGRRTSASAYKWLDYHIYTEGTIKTIQHLQVNGWRVYATTVGETSTSLYDVDFTAHEKVAILLGNEHKGLSPEAVEQADVEMHIPMSGMVESFNVSVAAAITIAEVTRQRDASPKQFRVNQQQADEIVKKFILRSRKKTEIKQNIG